MTEAKLGKNAAEPLPAVPALKVSLDTEIPCH